MREIKFRGKLKHEDIWVYGDLRQNYGGTTGIVANLDGKFVTYFVDPETVGQYTGLKDKNGTEIYEGDLLNGHEVYGSPQWAMFAMRGDAHVGALVRYSDLYAVSGNVHENRDIQGGV